VTRCVASLVVATFLVTACGDEGTTPIPEPSELYSAAPAVGDADPSPTTLDSTPSGPASDAIGPPADAVFPAPDGQDTAPDSDPSDDAASTTLDSQTPGPEDTAGAPDDTEDSAPSEDATVDAQDVDAQEDTPAQDSSEPDGDLGPPACQPDCAGSDCGDDGCGGSCGGCDDGNPCTVDFCTADQTCNAAELALMPCASPPCSVNNHCLYDVPRAGLSATERIAAISAQGILAQHRPAIWLGGGQASPIHRARLVSDYGVNFVEDPALWPLLARFTDALSGYVLYDANTSSQSVALSLAGVLGTVAVTPSLEAQAQAAGLEMVLDVRGLDEAWCWENYSEQFAPHMLAEQWETTGHGEWLVDFPISERAFIYFDETCGDLRTVLAAQLDSPIIYGWGAECGEYDFVKGASLGGASVVASDFSSNLSVLARVEGAPVTGNNHATDGEVTEEGVHYVAFVMSDGDNIQFLQNAFDDDRWWGSAERGSFPMNWEVSPVLPRVAPTILTWLYESATPNDYAVAAPSGAGYALPTLHSDPLGLAQDTGVMMTETDMRVVTVLDGEGDLESCDPFAAQPGIDAVMYKDWGDYNAFQGALRWAYGKPILSFRYLLWNNGTYQDSPEGVAASVNSAPANPTNDIRSYSLVNAHAWSEWPASPNGTGAMGAVAWTVSMLDEHVRVVSAEALFAHLTKHLQGVTEEGGSLLLQAETDLSHAVGYADGQGWACNTAEQQAGHMCYGPYTSALDPGLYAADFDLMVDINGAPGVDVAVATVDVFDSQSQTLLAARELTRFEFDAPFSYQTFSLPFTNPEGSVLEFRVFWHATSYVNVDKVLIH
jgi:hypothetical protein